LSFVELISMDSVCNFVEVIQVVSIAQLAPFNYEICCPKDATQKPGGFLSSRLHGSTTPEG